MGRDPGKGLLGLEECADRIKELRRQREDLLSRRVDLQKKSRAQARVLPIPTRLMDEYIRQMRPIVAQIVSYRRGGIETSVGRPVNLLFQARAAYGISTCR